MTDTNYAAALTKFAAENKTMLEGAADTLNSVKGKLRGSFVVCKHAGAMQPEALVTIKYFEADGSADGYTHCVNYSDRSIYGNAPGTVTPSITMVSRGGRGKSYKEYRMDGGVLTVEAARMIVRAIKMKRAKFLKNIAASVAYAEGSAYRPHVLSIETVEHFKTILRTMG